MEPEMEPSKELEMQIWQANFIGQLVGGINGMQVGESAVRMRFPIWLFWQGCLGESPGAPDIAAPLETE